MALKIAKDEVMQLMKTNIFSVIIITAYIYIIINPCTKNIIIPYTVKLFNGKTFVIDMQMTIHGKTFVVDTLKYLNKLNAISLRLA